MKVRLDLPEAEVLWTADEVRAFVQDVYERRPVLAYDTETSGLEYQAQCYLATFAYRTDGVKGRRLLVPFYAAEHFDFWDIIRPMMEDPTIWKLAHNAGYDHRIMGNHQVEVAGLLADTMKMHHLYMEEDDHSLKDCAKILLNLQLLEFKEIFGKKITRTIVKDFMENLETRAKVVEYATLDAWATLELYEFLYKQLKRLRWYAPCSLEIKGVKESSEKPGCWNANLWHQHQVIDVPLIRILNKFHRRGIPANRDYLASLEAPIRADIAEITKTICDRHGTPINPGSPKQMERLFYDTLNFPALKRTGGGGRSVDEETLNKLWNITQHPTITDTLKVRGLTKTAGTYLQGLIKSIADDQRIHAEFSATAVTGRIRGYNPNVLNLPRADDDPYKIRKAIQSRPGYVLIVVDYEQLELVIVAGLSQDQSMLDAINQGLDLHCVTVRDMYHHPYEEVVAAKKKKSKNLPLNTREQQLVNARNAAKRIAFGLNYGMGANKLAIRITEDTGVVCSVDQAQAMLDRYLEVRSGLAAWREGIIEQVHELGYVTTVMGRYRSPQGINRGSFQDIKEAERQALNAPIQGTAMDIIAQAMLQIEAEQELERMGVQMLLQVHDELVFEAPEEVAEEALPYIKDRMENPKGWPGIRSVKPRVSGGIGHDWVEAK